MKVAVVFNRESKNVINLFGVPNKEKYGKETIKLITDALKKGGHIVETFEADKLLITNLEKFMPRVVKGELPGMVFNVSYGIQGQARYTHVPSILEMLGIPYTGSGPLAHSLALDKVVAKMIFREQGLPTPDFAVLETPESPIPDMAFPLIVKPKDEAVSFGLKIVYDKDELREGAAAIYKEFDRPVLVEQYIEGREINVSLMGNDPPEALPPVELLFDDNGPPIYTMEDKKHTSGREIKLHCPAEIGPEITAKASELSIRAFNALGCRDSGRVDMRIDNDGNLYILEINSMASLGPGGSLPYAVRHIGLDYTGLINRLIEVASARYFGTPTPPVLKVGKGTDRKQLAFSFLTQRRDLIERRVNEWCNFSSRTSDPVGSRRAAGKLRGLMEEIGLKQNENHSDNRSTWLWSTKKGFEGGSLLIMHLDVPLPEEAPGQAFRRDPEFLFGEGIGSSRAPMVMVEYAMRALKAQKLLHLLPLGVMAYSDEGQESRYSEHLISAASKKAGRVLVLRPGLAGGKAISQRRGQVKYKLEAEGKPIKLGQTSKNPDAFLWLASKITALSELNSRKKRSAVSVVHVRSQSFPTRLPHRITATVLVSYYDLKVLENNKKTIRKILDGPPKGFKWELEEISNRPPMKERKSNRGLAEGIKDVANEWEIPFSTASSLLPSVAGLVPEITPVLCGLGPVVEDLYTPNERIYRISLIQQILLLTEYLLSTAGK